MQMRIVVICINVNSLLLLLCVLPSFFSLAESNAIEKIVVTGTRSEISQIQSPVSVDVISAEQLQLRSLHWPNFHLP